LALPPGRPGGTIVTSRVLQDTDGLRDWCYCGRDLGDHGGTTTTRRHRGQEMRPLRRRDPRLTQRDIDGLLLCGEQYGAPFDLLAAALGASKVGLPQVVKRWRNFGYAANGRLGPGAAWCWLTRDGMTAAGLGFSPVRPALGRLAHIRAVLAARLWLTAGQAWHDGQAWWRCERRPHRGRPRSATGHVPDAEIHWPSIHGSPYAGQVWALELRWGTWWVLFRTGDRWGWSSGRWPGRAGRRSTGGPA